MKILVTGANGFIGRNLIAELRNQGYTDIFLYDVDTEPDLLDTYTAKCDFIFHLAGVNRPENPEKYIEGNCGFTELLLSNLIKHKNKATVLATSSIQANLDNPYGNSKRAGESLLFAYQAEVGASVLVYQLPNVFGKWCRPNYNSVIATFCHNTARNVPLQLNNPETEMSLVYIDDVVAAFINAMEGNANWKGEYCTVDPVFTIKLGQIADLLHSFYESRVTLKIPDLSNAFTKNLYSTYLSYLPEDAFSYRLTSHTDTRGSFTEMIRTANGGQVSVNISKPGVTKGNHWHQSKIEKFVVVQGEALLQFKQIDSETIFEHRVSGNELRVVDIPPGFIHNIINIGREDLVVFIWANECFEPNRPDTWHTE